MSYSRARILIVQNGTQPCGGKEAVFGWILESLCSQYDVTILCWDLSIDAEAFNRQYGTSLVKSAFRILRPSKTMRLLRRCLLFLDRDPASIQPAMLLMRSAKEVRGHYDFCVSCEMETDMGLPGLQYIHYPWLGKFSRAMAKNNKLSFWPRVFAVASKRLPPWMIVGDFSCERMRTNRTITNSDWTGRCVQRAYGINTTTICPPGAGVFERVPWNERSNGFLCTGRIHPEKRIDWLIDSLQPLRPALPDMHLHLVGKIPDKIAERGYYSMLERLVQANRDWITLHINLNRTELEQLAVKQRYGLHAMVDEHFGMAVAEMVRAGCIPFVHNSGGVVEIIDRDDRLLYKTAGELQERILHVVRNPGVQRSLLSDLERSADRFTPELFVTEIRRVIADCLEVNG